MHTVRCFTGSQQWCSIPTVQCGRSLQPRHVVSPRRSCYTQHTLQLPASFQSLQQLSSVNSKCSRQHGSHAVITRAATAQAEVAVGDTYEVYLDKPIGVRFARGNDGAAYIAGSDARIGMTDDRIAVADKIVEVSASFGSDVWKAQNYGQVIYAIKTRNGQLYLKLRKGDGSLDIFQEEELTEMEKRFKEERGGGNYGEGTKELQAKNYAKRKNAEAEREERFEKALSLFQKKDIEAALIEFENVLAMEPKNYIGDDFSRTSQIYRVTQYNIACCYSALGSVDAGIDALSDALNVGFDQFKVIRNDKNLEKLREDPRFQKLIDSYDEPIFSGGAFEALRGVFSFGKKEDKSY